MTTRSLNKILIANRGEIALRIIRAIHALDRRAVVVHSDYDADLLFVHEADEAYSLGQGGLAETYLNQEKILDVAREAGADAIHPGYGFLSENASFAAACLEAGIQFIGPRPEAIRLMGDKASAREKARELGLPVLDGIIDSLEGLIRKKDSLPYPVLIKPSAGGGGKGMRIVPDASGFEEAARDASREAENYFGSGSLYVEKYLENPRHIEVQVIADHHGASAHLFERECTLQRRYQKIIEEAPSVSLSDKTRQDITRSALLLVDGMGYTNAGTVEFLLDNDQSFYFLEMNTRIQVEHPVTEMITGIDLVREQITIAEGAALSFKQEDVRITGHAIEARIYAEDPEKSFLPATGRIGVFQCRKTPDCRIDSGFSGGNLVEPYYDPMLAKLIVRGSNREEARNHLISQLKELHITGLRTNRDFLIALVREDAFGENRIHTRYVDQELQKLLRAQQQRRSSFPTTRLLAAATLIALQSNGEEKRSSGSPWAAIGHWRILPQLTLLQEDQEFPIRYELLKGRERMRLKVKDEEFYACLEEKSGDHHRIRIDNHVMHLWGTNDRSEVVLDVDGHQFNFRRPDILDERYMGAGRKRSGERADQVVAPLNGRVVQISAGEGDRVRKGEPLLVIESMKMENKVLAVSEARVKNCHVSVGDQVQTNQLLYTLEHYDTSTDQRPA